MIISKQAQEEGYTFFDVIWVAADIIFTMVPPGLSLSLSLGLDHSYTRLSKLNISTMKIKLINAAGRMRSVLFDKTGTLTADDVTLKNIFYTKGPASGQLIELQKSQYKVSGVNNGPNTLLEANGSSNESEFLIFSHFLNNHTLVQDEEIPNKIELIGDPFELQLYNFAKDNVSDTFEVLNIFEFNPKLKRMSVVTKHEQSKRVFCFVKGAPEVILSLCKPKTVPQQTRATLKYQAQNGYRVYALGYRELDPSSLKVISL